MKTETPLKLLLLAVVLFVASTTSTRYGHAQSLTLKGVIKGANGYTVMLLNPDGSSQTKALPASGIFTFTGLKTSSIKNRTLHLVSEGRYVGPIVLGKKGSKVSITLSGKNPTKAKVINLGKIALKDGYALAPKSLKAALYTIPRVSSDTDGKPIGAGRSGIIALDHASRSRVLHPSSVTNPGEDTDNDGISNAFDADDNGNSILDSADPASEGSDIPYVALHFDFRRTLNAHVRSGLTPTVIDEVIAGENLFSSTFFISLPQESAVDGGHLVCGDALSYCRPGSPLGYSGGVSESSSAYRGPMSTLANSAGYPILEPISLGGGRAMVLSIQPRVGRDVFRPGDLYRVVLTSGTTEVSSRTFTLPPYFISVPAIKDYTANGVTTTVDYSAVSATSGSIPGVSPSEPIVLGADGVLTLNFWRPQREPLNSESGYQDFGALNYGVIIDSAQATCAGYYSTISGDLVEDPTALGTDSSPLAHQGANLNPLVDQVTDRAAVAGNTLSLTVNLKNCLSRSGGSPGTYLVTLSAVGSELTGGRNAANQIFYVAIP